MTMTFSAASPSYPAWARTKDPIEAVADNDLLARLRTNSRASAKMSQQKIEGGNHDRIQ
jgi:hypothetical protein